MLTATKADNLYKYLQTNDHFSGGHNIITTQPIVNDIISQIPTQDQDFLVMYNIEFVISLVYNYNVDPKDITFYTDNDNKTLLAARLGVAVITDLTEYNMKKPPVLLTNPPYTKETNDTADGKTGRTNLYTPIIRQVVEATKPTWIGMVTPEALYTSPSPRSINRRLRDDLFTLYSPKTIKFLHQERDWDNTIRIDTVAAVLGPRESGSTFTVNGRHLNQTFDIGVTLDDTRVFNYETLEIYNWVYNIQTGTKLITSLPEKNTKTSGPSMQISKKAPLSCNVINGTYSDSDNAKWRVAIGTYRCNTCAVVAPGVSIPNKYRYYSFDTEHQATKFRNFLLSEPVRFIIKLFHNSRGLGAESLQFVPIFDLDLIQHNGKPTNNTTDIVDADLYDYWNISQSLRKYVHDFMTNLPNNEKVPF